MTDANEAEFRLATLVLEQEFGDAGHEAAVAEAAARAWERLSQRLTNILTAAGCQALLSRALYLAQRDFPVIKGVSGQPGLQGLNAAFQGLERPQALNAATAVVAHAVVLLVSFLGEDLALRAISDVWPDAPRSYRQTAEQEVLA